MGGRRFTEGSIFGKNNGQGQLMGKKHFQQEYDKTQTTGSGEGRGIREPNRVRTNTLKAVWRSSGRVTLQSKTEKVEGGGTDWPVPGPASSKVKKTKK